EGMLLRGIKAATFWWMKKESWLYDSPTCFKLPLKEYSEMMRNSNPTTGLQLLAVRGNDFTQEFAEISTDLVWLRWFEFPRRNLPSLEKLSVLELYKAEQLEELWEDETT
ncbi:hypothetical protein KI387_033322, partial [Taxus chinensis]